MRLLRLRLLLLLLVFLAFAASTIAARSDPALEKSVAELASLLTDGYAELDQGKLLPIRSSNMVAVLFNLQGPAKGNGSWQFLAFFEANASLSSEFPNTSPYRLLAFKKIGSRGARLFNPATATFQSGQLTVGGSAFKPSDAMCCPSLPIRSTFVIQDGQVVERSVDNEFDQPLTRSTSGRNSFKFLTVKNLYQF